MSKDTTAKLKRLAAIWRQIDNSESKILEQTEESSLFSIEELAAKFSVSKRTVLRDLALVKKMGIDFSYFRGKRSTFLSSEFDFSLEQLQLTPHMAATLCVAYEEARKAGSSFATVCQAIKEKFVPHIEQCEINPPLPYSPLVSTLQKAIKQHYYVKITTAKGTEFYIKPYCFIRLAKKRIDLVYAITRELSNKSVVEKIDDFCAISLTSIQKVRIITPHIRSRSLHFVPLKHQKWAAFAFIRFYAENFLAKNK